jgi:hypothetical protein
MSLKKVCLPTLLLSWCLIITAMESELLKKDDLTVPNKEVQSPLIKFFKQNKIPTSPDENEVSLILNFKEKKKQQQKSPRTELGTELEETL